MITANLEQAKGLIPNVPTMFSVIKSTKLAVGILMMSGIEEMLNYYEAFRKVLPSKLFEYKTISKPILAGVNGCSE